MKIHKTIDKDLLKEMPKVLFAGEIHIASTPEEAERAVTFLKSFPLLGIDTETRPSFTKGHSHKVALLQVSADEHCFLFRLNQTGLTLPIIQLLESTRVTKVGLSLKDDFHALHNRAPFEPRAYIELQQLVREFGIEEMSLQKIYGILFGERISKTQRLSNWEAEHLTIPQQQYAATDAWACLNIFHRLMALRQSGDYEVVDDRPPAEEEAHPSPAMAHTEKATAESQAAPKEEERTTKHAEIHV